MPEIAFFYEHPAWFACDAYVRHGDPVSAITPKIADMRRWSDAGGPPMTFDMAAYAIVGEAEPRRELDRITAVAGLPAGYANFDQWLPGTQLERELSIEEYSVPNRLEYEAAGLDLLLLQMSPQAEEMERFAAQAMVP